MPKIIPIADKRKWLHLYEAGKSEASIAVQAKRDPKTIKNGIADARLERSSAAAVSQQIADALRSHQNALGAVVERVKSVIRLPAHDMEIRRNPNGTHAITPLPGGGSIEYDPAVGLILLLEDEATPYWGLLREHLRGDRLWGLLDRWKTAMTEHMRARTALKNEASSLLESYTKLKVKPETSQAVSSVFPLAVDLFYSTALQRTLGISETLSPETSLTAASEGYVVHPAGRLAYCPNATKQCKAKMVAAFNELPTSVAARQVAQTYAALVQATDKARTPVEDVSMLGLITGHCRVCRRLGVM